MSYCKLKNVCFDIVWLSFSIVGSKIFLLVTQGGEAGEGLTAVMRGHPGGANLLAFRSTFNSEVRRGQRGRMSVHLPRVGHPFFSKERSVLCVLLRSL